MNPRCSVIIVSRHRPAALLRCIAALRQQDHDNFELVVVADPAAIAGLAADIRAIPFDQANISAARNLGLMAATAPILAFIDDDAVAEPFWLSRLTQVFADPQVMAATGFVRGRNGLSWQWRAVAVDDLGQDQPLDVTETTLMRGVKTHGTNCAFRADALRAIGGFDPALRFYLDDTDVARRLPGLTAIVPGAVVHHGFLASERRRADRVPLTLFDIAASVAVFLRRHGGALSPAALIAAQSQRLDQLRRAGKLSAAQVAALMQTLHQGWESGLIRDLPPLAPLPAPKGDFQPLAGIGPRPQIILSGRFWQRHALIRQARALQGQIVTIICLSPNLRPHWLTFDPAGYWLQTGGIWGRADRQGPRLIWGGFARRVAMEAARLMALRQPVTPAVNPPITPKV